MAICALGVQTCEADLSILSHSLGDIPVSGEQIKMEKEINPEGPEGDADAARESSSGCHGAL